MQAISSVAFGLIAGVIGWFAAEFFGKPLRRGLDLCERTRKETIRHGSIITRGSPALLNVDPGERTRLREAADMYREVGAELQAFAKTEPLATWALERFWRCQVHEAGIALVAVSNDLLERDYPDTPAAEGHLAYAKQFLRFTRGER